jgi:hypothetical protein
VTAIIDWYRRCASIVSVSTALYFFATTVTRPEGIKTGIRNCLPKNE